MAKYFVHSIFMGLFLLAQFSNVLSNVKDDFAAQQKLSNVLISDFAKFIDPILVKCTSIINGVLEDPNLQEVETETLRNKLDEIRALVNDANELAKANVSSNADQVDQFNYAMAEIRFSIELKSHLNKYVMPNGKLSSEDALIANALVAHGIKDLKEKFIQTYPKLEENIHEAIDEFVSTTSDEYSKEEFIQLQNKLDSAKSVMDHLNMYLNFLKELL